MRPVHTIALVAALSAAGCSSNSEAARPACHPVRGELTYNGKPAKGAVVRFTPLPVGTKLQEGALPHGKVGDDGTFVVSCYGTGDGAPEGEYALTVTWTGEDGGPGPDRFQMRFHDAKKPPRTLTVKPGKNAIDPIRLTGPALK